MISLPNQEAVLSADASDPLQRPPYSTFGTAKSYYDLVLSRLLTNTWNWYFRGRLVQSFLCFGYFAYLRILLFWTDSSANIRFSLVESTLLPARYNPSPPQLRWAVSLVHLSGLIFRCSSAISVDIRLLICYNPFVQIVFSYFNCTAKTSLFLGAGLCFFVWPASFLRQPLL